MHNATFAASRLKPSSPAIDVPLAELIGLAKAAKLLPPHDDGTPRGFHFVLRMVKAGRLRAVRVGRSIMTHPDWLNAAFEQINMPTETPRMEYSVEPIDAVLDAAGL